jgi:AraC-like DNA-binding protein
MEDILSAKRHLFFSVPEQAIPLYIESLGYNPQQEDIVRPNGFPHYHWLQTVAGEGEVEFEGRTIRLREQEGLFFLPHVPHRYQRVGKAWSTTYITFNGPAAHAILDNLDFRFSAIFDWEKKCPFDFVLRDILEQEVSNPSNGELNRSLELYRFLILLKTHCRMDKAPSIHSLSERLSPLIWFLEAHYSEPDLDTKQMAEVLHVSPRHLTALFQTAFGSSPYQYLLKLRMRKAKEFLSNDHSVPIKIVAGLVGFRDPSHFAMSFRNVEGLAPERFRERDRHPAAVR